MKQIRVFGAVLFTSCFFVMGCSQKTEEKQTAAIEKTAAEKATDSATIAAEKKKAAEAEKGKLPKPYHPEDDAEAKIAELVTQAKKENKNIILQAGGNWCIWCLRLNNFVQTNDNLKSTVDQNYLYYHLNYSPENKNEKTFAKYGNPGDKYGYPVLLVLDKDGKLIHTQETGGLEEGKGYSLTKVQEFFEKWKPAM